jgi:hypothetical protein
LGEDVGRNLAKEPDDRDGRQDGAGPNARARVPFSPIREEDERANALGLVITAAMLFVLFAAAMLFGNHGAIGSIPPRHGVSMPDAKAMGHLVYGAQETPSCAQMFFDDATGSVAMPAELCSARNGGAASHPHD